MTKVPEFADRVRIKDSEETRALDLVGRVGQIYGWTTPSVTGVSVIGSPTEDYAVNVHFDDLESEYWFADYLLETVDHGAGTVFSIDGQSTEWVRLPNGEWQERPRSR